MVVGGPFIRVAILIGLIFVAQVSGANATSTDTYYGPMKSGQGYKDQTMSDGFWRIEGATRGRQMLAIDVAIYRAAEMAQSSGSKYVEIHDATEGENRNGDQRAILFARPVQSPTNPATCRSGMSNRCYTADVSVIMKRLSGASGNQPGMAAPSYIDKFGRTVTQSGYGVGAVTQLIPVR